MTDQTQEVARRSPQQALADDFRDPQHLERLQDALPENVSLAKFTRVALIAANEKPELVEVYQRNPRSLWGALTRCAAAGLLPDGKQAAINVYKTKVKQDGADVWLPTAQFLPMIGGLRHILAQYGWTLRTRVVYSEDEYDYSEEPPSIIHKPVRPGAERGHLIAAYAIAIHLDGRRLQCQLNADDIAKRRAKAKTQKIWDEWTEAMWEKSAGHAIFDDIPLGMLETERVRAMLSEQEGLNDPETALYGAPSHAALPAPQPREEAGGVPPSEQAGPARREPHPEGPAESFDFDEVSVSGETGNDGDSDPGGVATDGGEGSPSEPPPSAADWDPGDLSFDSGPYKGASIRVVASSPHGRDFLLACLLSPRLTSDHPMRQAIEEHVREGYPILWGEYQSRRAAL